MMLLILWDNDTFGATEWRKTFREIQDGGLRVSFNQGVNARLMNEENAEALAHTPSQLTLKSFHGRTRGNFLSRLALVFWRLLAPDCGDLVDVALALFLDLVINGFELGAFRTHLLKGRREVGLKPVQLRLVR
jgi:hypothetical protein